MDGNFTALGWLVFCGHGRSLSEKDKSAMREAGYMDENDCATVLAEQALCARSNTDGMVMESIHD